jgi:glucan-binding YG repeat protein
MVKGWLTIDGKTYYLQSSTGVLLKGWITVSGQVYYAEPKKGVIQKSTWVGNKYLTSSGVMATGFTDIGGKTYLFNSSGVKQTGWVNYDGKTYYLTKKGVLQKNKWIDKKYLQSDGSLAKGLTTIGSKTYYFGTDTGKMKTGWKTINGNKYFFNKKTGVLQKNKWLSSKKYYASDSGAILKGLNAVGNNLYFFNTSSGKKVTSTKKTIDGATYYFQSDGTAAKSKWVKISKKYYYFQADGKMAKSTWVGKYYVNENGVRTKQTKSTGWTTVNDVKYYFDSNGNMLTGWQTISGSKYYFSAAGAMLTGIQTIGTSKYYFYSDGKLATSLTIVVGTKQYTINSKGVVTAEESLKVSENTLGGKIVNFALQYVGNPYVYGGTSLTKGADCSGFTQTVLANFDIKILRVADDQMKGPSSAYIKQGYKAAVVVDIGSIQPGDLIFYGTSNYASHVGIYIGNGKIVHASNSQPYPSGGIKISAYNYNTPIRAVRYWS